MSSAVVLILAGALALGGAPNTEATPAPSADWLTEDADRAGARVGAVEDWLEEKQLRDGVAEVNEQAREEATVGVVAHSRPSDERGGSGNDLAGFVPRGSGFESVGVCMVSDAGPEVVRLPRCADLIGGEGGDSREDEPEGEDSEESEPVVITVSRSDFAELPLVSPVVHLQPERDWFLVNMDMLVFADDDAQVLETTVLGVPVAVRATPVRFSWDFGDGSPALVTTGAGAPWPAEDISHVYTGEAEGVVITVTTTWSGQFQVAGRGPWIPIAGSTTTTSQSAPFRIEAVETHLTAHG